MSTGSDADDLMHMATVQSLNHSAVYGEAKSATYVQLTLLQTDRSVAHCWLLYHYIVYASRYRAVCM
jgi:hypothetical protein